MSSRHHVPQRTCVACRKVTAQRELVRLVRSAHNTVEVDPGGRKPGRGSYLCRAEDCWEAGLKRGVLERALRTRLTPENKAQLMQYRKSGSEE